jgi:hypothetical protein
MRGKEVPLSPDDALAEDRGESSGDDRSKSMTRRMNAASR